MLVLAKAVLSIMLGFSVSVIFGYFAIKWLKKKHIRQQVSSTLGERHKKKNGTPTTGGIIFIIPTVHMQPSRLPYIVMQVTFSLWQLLN